MFEGGDLDHAASRHRMAQFQISSTPHATTTPSTAATDTTRGIRVLQGPQRQPKVQVVCQALIEHMLKDEH